MEDTRWKAWETTWGQQFEQQAIESMQGSDAGHDIEHVRRVVKNANRLGMDEACSPEIVLPAAWLHDCVSVPKNSPLRSQSSRLAAKKATEIMQSLHYPAEYYQAIQHAIESHSFSAAIECQSIEAKVVQDADRLEAVGAIGIARCLMTGGSLGHRLYDPVEPFPLHRKAEDHLQSVDHFFCKLFKLPTTMKTEAGRTEAQRRSESMLQFLIALASELDIDPKCVHECLVKYSVA